MLPDPQDGFVLYFTFDTKMTVHEEHPEQLLTGFARLGGIMALILKVVLIIKIVNRT